MRRNAAMAAVVLLLVCVASSVAFAQKTTVLRVVVVKTENPAAYAQEIEKGRPDVVQSSNRSRRYGGRIAGPEAGAMVVSIEYPSLDAFADAYKKTNARPELAEGL